MKIKKGQYLEMKMLLQDKTELRAKYLNSIIK